MTVDAIEKELKKLIAKPAWKRKQSDEYDVQTNFIYHTFFYEDLMSRLKTLLTDDLRDYAINRWFNFWSAQGVEKIFRDCKNVKANINSRDKLVDFSINEINFDHKTSVFPREFQKNFDYAKTHKKELIKWLYLSQSREGRFHAANRLFIILHKQNGDDWQLRKELKLLQPAIHDYVANFTADNLVVLKRPNGQLVLSDIIFFEG